MPHTVRGVALEVQPCRPADRTPGQDVGPTPGVSGVTVHLFTSHARVLALTASFRAEDTARSPKGDLRECASASPARLLFGALSSVALLTDADASIHQGTGRDTEGGNVMRRATIALLALGLMVGTTFAATGHAGTGQERSGGNQRFVRWDLIQFVGNVILAGGENVATDAKTGDTLTLTGSGQAEPGEREAAGGGTFVHADQGGTEMDSGAYYVTGFISWRPLAGGSLDGLGLTDGIGNGPGAQPDEGEPSSGVLKLRIHAVAVVDGEPQEGVNGVLIVYCHLPGTIVDVPEGVAVRVPAFDLNFRPTSGVTLFHRLR